MDVETPENTGRWGDTKNLRNGPGSLFVRRDLVLIHMDILHNDVECLTSYMCIQNHLAHYSGRLFIRSIPINMNISRTMLLQLPASSEPAGREQSDLPMGPLR